MKGEGFCLFHSCLELCWHYCDYVERNKCIYIYGNSKNGLYLPLLSSPWLGLSNKILSINCDEPLLYVYLEGWYKIHSWCKAIIKTIFKYQGGKI